jgi:hypothetical protein
LKYTLSLALVGVLCALVQKVAWAFFAGSAAFLPLLSISDLLWVGGFILAGTLAKQQVLAGVAGAAMLGFIVWLLIHLGHWIVVRQVVTNVPDDANDMAGLALVIVYVMFVSGGLVTAPAAIALPVIMRSIYMGTQKAVYIRRR